MKKNKMSKRMPVRGWSEQLKEIYFDLFDTGKGEIPIEQKKSKRLTQCEENEDR